MHTRKIGLATRNQSALFMMGINWYYRYVKCALYSVDSTASQQKPSLSRWNCGTSNLFHFVVSLL